MTTAGVIDSLARDARQAVRGLRRSPLFTVVALLTLAIGIGATTAVFSVVDQTLLRPAPFAHADRLVDVIDIDRARGGGGNSLTPAKIVGWQREPGLFEAFEAYAPRQFDVTGDVEPERVQGLLVSTGLFDMLGITPRINTGIAHREAGVGQIGAGITTAPLECFLAAIEAVAVSS